MPQQEDKIHAADEDKEKQLAPPRRSARVKERKARETAAGKVNTIFTQQPPPPREQEKKKPPPTTQKEGKKKIFSPPLPEGREKEEEREV
jgi:hypothetical protein